MRKRGIWDKIAERLREIDNENKINISEFVVAIDSQSIKTNNRFEKAGYDGDEEIIKLLNAI